MIEKFSNDISSLELSKNNEYNIDGYKVIYNERNIINEEDTSNLDPDIQMLKEMVREVANYPELKVFSGGTQLIGSDFDKIRSEWWNNPSILSDKIEISRALSSGSTYSRVKGLGSVLNMMKEHGLVANHVDEWKSKLDQIAKIDDYESQKLELDNLFIEINKGLVS